jgi:tryptophan-rich sensory protein
VLDVEVGPLVVSAAVCVSLAVLGNLWVGDALKTWYPALAKPRFLPPLWAFIVVAVLVYVVEGVALYRLLVHVAAPEGKVVGVTALVAVMVCNEAWNYAFFGLRSTLAALVGIIGFLAPLTVLMVALFAYEPVSGWLMLPYCGWVAYDAWWVHRLWRLNPGGPDNPGAAPDRGGTTAFRDV